MSVYTVTAGHGGRDPGAVAADGITTEAALMTELRDIVAAERDLAAVARTSLTGADEAWRALAESVEAQDDDARIQARQLVADTFERIIVYHRGVTPEDTPTGQLDIMLLAKGGTTRLLRIDKMGRVLAGEQAEAADTTEKDPPAP